MWIDLRPGASGGEDGSVGCDGRQASGILVHAALRVPRFLGRGSRAMVGGRDQIWPRLRRGERVGWWSRPSGMDHGSAPKVMEGGGGLIHRSVVGEGMWRVDVPLFGCIYVTVVPCLGCRDAARLRGCDWVLVLEVF